MTFYSLKKLSKSYQNKSALHQFSLELEEGEFISIVGESGSGKSTLLRIMAGLEIQDEGEVWLNGNQILNPKKKLVAGYDEIKLIHQDYQLYPNSTVAENIARPLLHYEKEYTKSRVETLLRQFGLLDFRDRFPRQLSGGQQQKVAIATALAIEPEVLLLDEPFSSLDTIQKHQLISELGDLLKAMDTTVVFVTHDLDDALRLTDQVLILQKGKTIQKGNSQELCEGPKTRYVARLFSPINLIPDRINSFLRPNDVKIRTKGGLLGHVIDFRYLVHYNSLRIKLKNGGEIWEVDDPSRKYQIGDRVYLQWDEEKVMVLKG
ncbi:ABC transporter ATP-binding protein [Algoriphagus zhangzhouensis]|uniref:Iron(III) transport system ATP-binding protein n=1 Tax=Algoriphagus zhangzhouensis TaxID=1073327 RepID=A0A1M7ZJF2_9BACT|nr:ABC transporter ATP-binding protein [Algoriphagus zhangzhouensis]TDY43555.1 iron(III) transport system ATP-binding protein [Algoriphagus zhangzhouensis]SHO65018.1 iron(III) transport system ATP-binding protein [Algoriphagus zhangzhouensis]